MPKVKGTPAFARLMVVDVVLNSSETSFTTLKNTVLLKQAESMIQLVAKTIMHLRQNGGSFEFIVAGDCMVSVLSVGSTAFLTPVLNLMGMNVVRSV